MNRARLAAIMAGVSFCGIPVGARADGSLEALLEERVVSTPSKSAVAATVAPGTTSVVTAEDLRRHGIRSLDEAINFLSMGMVATNPQHAVEVGSRGTLITVDYGNHVLLLVDGHTLNEAWNGTAYFERGAAIPFELVDHIEITLGPGSVLYGSQAMLGVINIVTKRAKDYEGVHVIGEGELTTATRPSGAVTLDGLGRGYRLGAGIGRSFDLFSLPAELTLQLEYYRQAGAEFQYALQEAQTSTGAPVNFGPRSMPGGWGGTVRDAYTTEIPAAYGRLVIEDVQVLARAGVYRRGIPYLDGIVSGDADFDDPASFERDRFLNLEASHRGSLSTTTVLRSRLYGDLNEYTWHSKTSEPEFCPETFGGGCRRELVGVSRVLGSEVSATFDWLHTGKLVTLLGGDARIRGVASTNDIVNLQTAERSATTPDSSRTDVPLAAYLEQTAHATPWLVLNAGARMDYDPRFGSRISPRAAAGVTPWPSGQIKAVYSEAFRAPTVYELEYRDPLGVLAAPDLRPETVRSAELSIEQRVSSHRFVFGVFRTWWNDMVTLALASDEELAAGLADGRLLPTVEEAYLYKNVSHIHNYGFNAGYEGSFLDRALQYGLNLTEAVAHRDLADGLGDQPITVGPRLFGNARVSYDLPGTLPTIGLIAQYQARRPADRAFDGGFAVSPYAPALATFRLTVSGEIPAVSGLSYRVSAAYTTTGVGPYVIGPNQYAYDETTRATLNPHSRLTAFAGLEYVFNP